MDLANLVRRAGATLLLAMLCLVTFAQGKTVTGTVVDGISTVSFLFRT